MMCGAAWTLQYPSLCAGAGLSRRDMRQIISPRHLAPDWSPDLNSELWLVSTSSCDWSTAPSFLVRYGRCYVRHAATNPGLGPGQWAVILRGHGVITQLLMLETRKINILKSPSALPEWWISDSVRRTCKADIAQCGDGDPMAVFSVSGTLWHCWHSSADSSGHQRKGARGSLVLYHHHRHQPAAIISALPLLLSRGFL